MPSQTSRSRTVAAVAVASMMLAVNPVTALAQEVLDRSAVENIIRDYLLKNPELLLEVQEILQNQHEEKMTEQQRQSIIENAALIYDAPYHIEFGNPDARITVVELFDYNCGFCQAALMDMQQIVEQEVEVRFILKEFPVLGEDSVSASRVSMAFSKLMPDRHAEFHVRLISLEGTKDHDRALQLAVEMGADRQSLLDAMEDSTIMQAIGQTYQLANELNIKGTPTYLIRETVISGAVGYEKLKSEVDKLLVATE